MTKFTRITALATALMITPLAFSQETRQRNPLSELRAELAVERTLFYPTQAVLVRFTLFNPTDHSIDLPPAAPASSEGVALPRGFVIGDDANPALFITYENEPPVALRDHALEGAPVGLSLRLAPKTSIGAQITINSFHRHVRYVGAYKLEWRPLGGAVPPVDLTFRVETRKDAVLVTDHGKVTFSLFYDKAPRNLENFIELVRAQFYNQKSIHRVIPGFIIQGGSPDGTSKGVRPDGRLIEAEFHDLPFEMGTLAMARKPNNPDSASCQFFISLGRLPRLDNKFTIIGQALDDESIRTLRRLAELPTDAKNQPLRPLTIRFFTLVDIPEYKTQDLGMTRP